MGKGKGSVSQECHIDVSPTEQGPAIQDYSRFCQSVRASLLHMQRQQVTALIWPSLCCSLCRHHAQVTIANKDLAILALEISVSQVSLCRAWRGLKGAIASAMERSSSTPVTIQTF